MLKTPIHYLIPVIIVLAVTGCYSINSNFIDIHIVLVTGIVGYILRKLDFSLASLLVGLVLGPLIEKYFVQDMLIEGGDPTAMFTAGPVSITIWAIVALTLLGGTINALLPKSRKITQVESLIDAE